MEEPLPLQHTHVCAHTYMYTLECYTFHFTDGALHLNHRAERPFPEEDPGSDGDGFLKPGLLPPSQLEGLKHFLHQVREGPCIPPYFLPFFISSFCCRSPGLWHHLPFRINTLSQLLTLSVLFLSQKSSLELRRPTVALTSPAFASLRYLSLSLLALRKPYYLVPPAAGDSTPEQ